MDHSEAYSVARQLFYYNWYVPYIVGILLFLALRYLDRTSRIKLGFLNPVVISFTVPFFLPSLLFGFDVVFRDLNNLVRLFLNLDVFGFFLDITVFLGVWHVGSLLLFLINAADYVLGRGLMRERFYYWILSVIHFFSLFWRFVAWAEGQ